MNFTEKRKTVSRRAALARLTSYVFNPLILPALSLFLVINEARDTALLEPAAKAWLLGTVAFGTCLFPLAGLYILYFFGYLRGPEIPDRHDRAVPFLSVTVSFLITFYVFAEHLPSGLTVLLLLSGAAFSVALVTMTTLFYKVSAHAAAAGAMAGFILGVSGFYGQYLLYTFLFSILLSGLIMSARMTLRIHTLAESLAGWFIGFSVCFYVFYRMSGGFW